MLSILFALVLASSEPWPQKGDTVYVSATLTLSLMSLYGANNDSPIPPCIASEVLKVKPEYWRIDPPNTPSLSCPILKGPWLPRLHQTVEECEAYLAEHGEPRMIRSASTHQIVPR